MKLKILGVLMILVFALMACQGTNDTGTGTDNPNIDPANFGNQTGNGMVNNRDFMMDRDAERYQNRDRDGRDNRMSQGRNNSRYEIAEEAAEKISEEVDNVERAYVLTTDNNAYVAVQLDSDNRNQGNNHGNIGRTNNRGDNDGNMNRNNNRGNNDGNMNRNNNRGNHDGNISTRDDGRIDSDNNRGNNRGNMTRTNNRDHDVPDNIKGEIADIVRSVDRNIEHVYVSTNPDFLDLANNYADDVDQGQPIEGLFDQMGTMIERIFPDNQR
ncbi:YhcN/YlaJ family sporulation lipoprotein [Oceanobacillus sp. CAU 1775]